jgi:hypothetical protein
VLSAATGTLELFGLYLGDRLGFYEALAMRSLMRPMMAASTLPCRPSGAGG